MIDILARPLIRTRAVPSLGLLIAVTMTGTALHIFVPAMPAAAVDLLSVLALLTPMVLYSVGMGLMSPNGVTGLMNAAPRAIGSASSLYGFAQMSFGAFVTLIVALWQDGSALPVAIVLVTSAAAGQLALHKA
jgi:DHA1 family bicyclomycin/chloramphenicol resistance-like MFS transporter